MYYSNQKEKHISHLEDYKSTLMVADASPEEINKIWLKSAQHAVWLHFNKQICIKAPKVNRGTKPFYYPQVLAINCLYAKMKANGKLVSPLFIIYTYKHLSYLFVKVKPKFPTREF